MNKLLLTFALLGALAPTLARAQDGPIAIEDAVPIPGEANPQMARVSVFIAGLKEPQGLALDSETIVICDYGAGEVLRFDKMGGKKSVMAFGLSGPSQIQIVKGQILVSERKANRVISVSVGQVTPIGGEIIEPLGLFRDSNLPSRTDYRVPILSDLPLTGSLFRSLDGIYAVAHTTSKIYRLEQSKWKLIYQPSAEDGDAGRYGLRCLANDGNTLFVSDEVNGDVLMMSQNGRMAKFASGFADPSGMEVRGDWLYVCDEGDGGRLWKVDKSGVKTLVAEKLGRPRNVLFLDDKTALVSERNGRVLKLNWTGGE